MNVRSALVSKVLSRQGQGVLIRRMATRAVANAAAASVTAPTAPSASRKDTTCSTKKRAWSFAKRDSSSAPYWSGSYTYSFASPESDFTSQSFPANKIQMFSSTPQQSWSKTLSFASPESDFSADTLEERANRVWYNSDVDRTNMAYSLSFASPESDFTSPHIQSLLSEQQRDQLAQCSSDLAAYDTRRELLDDHAHIAQTEESADDQDEQFHFEEIYAKTDPRPLPTTLHEATQINDDRAIVITEATVPFKIVRVSSAWEGLCEYTQDEAKGHTLGELLQGPETDAGAATALVDKLMHGEEAGAVLTNYAKGGRKFQNRIRVGTLKNQHNRVTHFVGVLKEIQEMSDAFEPKNSRMA